MIWVKTDRLIGILTILLQRSITARELAEKFEVSTRTVMRDIEVISMAGIPIVSTKGKVGGYSVMKGFVIDRTLLSKKEMDALLTGLRGLDSVSTSPAYRQLMDKLSAEDRGCVDTGSCFVIDLSCWGKETVADKIELIRHAAESRQLISFRYYAPSGESVRKIEPYNLIFRWKSWYVWGYCADRQDMRLFRLSRITGLENTGESFEPRDIPPYVSGVCNPDEHIAAVVKFDESVKWRVIDEIGPERMQNSSDGSCIAQCSWSDKASFLSFVLSFGDKAEIISPPCLRQEIAELAMKIAERNHE